MSLINEALRKARKEAAERDAEERGVTYRPPRAHLPAKNPWLPALAGGGVAGLVVAVVLVVLLRTGPGDASPEESPEPTVETSEVEAQPVESRLVESQPVESRPVESQPVEAQAANAQPVDPEPTATTAPSPPVTEPPVAEPPVSEPITPAPAPPEPVQPVGPAPEPTSTALAATTAAAPGSGTRSFVGQATVGDVTLKLDYIVWSESAPFAQVNGRMLEVGQAVDGFIVRSIEQRGIVLERLDERVELRLR